jgi:hypothetical protein
MKMKWFLGIMLSFALVLGLMPGMKLTVHADNTTFYPASTYNDFSNLVYSDTTVKIDGVKIGNDIVEWYVIGYQASSGTGTDTSPATVTLFAASDLATDVKFNLKEEDGNGYKNSVLQASVDGLMTMFSSISDVMIERTLSATNTLPEGNDYLLCDYIFGESVKTKLWPLSAKEAYDIKNSSSGSVILTGVWLLRSPAKYARWATCVNNGNINTTMVYYEYGVRPALQLDLSKVVFNSSTMTFSLNVDVTGVTLTKESTILTVGGTEALTATVIPENATDKKVKWNVGGTNAGAVKLYSDESCTTEVGTAATETLTVYAKGEAAGSAIVTCTSNADDTMAATCSVTVNNKDITATVEDVNVTYDESAHGIMISVTDPSSGATVMYGTAEGTYDKTASPTITNVEDSPKTIYYKISANGYNDTTGSAIVTINAADPTIPKGLSAFYGQTLANVALPEGWAWLDSNTSVGNIGTNTFKANYTATNTNYNSKSNVDLNILVSEKPPATITKEPTSNPLTYNGSAQELVTAGQASGGEIQYALGTATKATEPYSTSIPTKTEAGTYYVWYKAAGDGNHSDSNPGCVSVTVAVPEKVATPAFSPAAGTYTQAENVLISCATNGAAIHYTTDGTTPTSASTTYSGAITVSTTTTIRAIAVKDGKTGSDVATATYTINVPEPQKTDIASATVSGISNKTYTGKVITQSPTVVLDNKTLQNGTDYTLSYENNVNAGTATVTITATGSYTGSLQKTFVIAKANQTITATDISKTTTDAAFSIKASTNGGGQLSYISGNTKVVTIDSNGKVTIKGAGKTTITVTAAATANFKKATKTINVTVTSKSTTKKSIAKAVITGIKDKTYTGKAITQSPTVKLGGKKLKAGTDYTVSYKNNKIAGTATITITGTGGYKGTATAKFNIKKAANTLNVKAQKTTYNIAYSKLSKKDQGIKETKIYKVVKKGKGKLSYSFSSAKTGKKNVKNGFAVDKKTGKLTVKKGLKKGTYNIEIKVTAAGDKNHKKGTKKITISLNVK